MDKEDIVFAVILFLMLVIIAILTISLGNIFSVPAIGAPRGAL